MHRCGNSKLYVEEKQEEHDPPARKREDLHPKCFATFGPLGLWNQRKTSGKETFLVSEPTASLRTLVRMKPIHFFPSKLIPPPPHPDSPRRSQFELVGDL